MRDTFIGHLGAVLAERERDDLMLITGDLGFGVFDDFANRFSANFLNAGVAEQAMTGLAAGLALADRTVFTYSIGNFPTIRALEQIRNDVAYHGLPVCIVAIGGGFSYGPLGFSHHALEDVAIMRAVPGVDVYVPSTKGDVIWALDRFLELRLPAYLRLDKSAAPDPDFPTGSPRWHRSGDDHLLIGMGGVVEELVRASKRLASDGVSAAVVSVPLVDSTSIEDVARAAGAYPAVTTVEEHVPNGGLGSAVCEAMFRLGLGPGTSVRTVSVPTNFVTAVGSQDYLRRAYGLDAESIASVVLGATANT